MKASVIPVFFVLFHLSIFSNAQIRTPWAIERERGINLNDTSFLRIYNGLVVRNNLVISHFDNFRSITDQKEIKNLGLASSKKVRIVNYRSSSLRGVIDSMLYSNEIFTSSFPFPLDIQLPIMLNGRILIADEEQRRLVGLTANQIKRVRYRSPERIRDTWPRAPFGAIEIFL